MSVIKEIVCPICGKMICKKGGGIADCCGVTKCTFCGNWIDCDTEMIAREEDIPILSDIPQQVVMGEANSDDMNLLAVTPTEHMTMHPACRAGVLKLIKDMREMYLSRRDDDKLISELVELYAGRYRLDKQVTDDMVVQAKLGSLDFKTLEELVVCIAHRAMCLQQENEHKDKLLELYKKQDEVRKQYYLGGHE